MRRTLTGAFIALAAWSLIMLVMPFVGPSGRQVAVVGDSKRAVQAIVAAGGMIVEIRQGVVLARSDRQGFVPALYSNGARLVIEGRVGTGCFSSLRR
jgi:hypothetical protein